jgi:hypothetical protein
MERSDSITLGTLAHFRHFELIQSAETKPLPGLFKAGSSGPDFYQLYPVILSKFFLV